LTAVTDRLLHFAVDVDPPAGFETKAVASMVPGRAVPQRASRRVRALATGVVVVLCLLTGIVVGRSLDRPTSSPARAGPIVTSSGSRIGEADLDASARRIVLTMDRESQWPGTWRCELDDGRGRWVEVGSWTADDVNSRVWASGVDQSLVDARRMRIRDDAGDVVAVATLERV
jgi:hypothetical protein